MFILKKPNFLVCLFLGEITVPCDANRIHSSSVNFPVRVAVDCHEHSVDLHQARVHVLCPEGTLFVFPKLTRNTVAVQQPYFFPCLTVCEINCVCGQRENAQISRKYAALSHRALGALILKGSDWDSERYRSRSKLHCQLISNRKVDDRFLHTSICVCHFQLVFLTRGRTFDDNFLWANNDSLINFAHHHNCCSRVFCSARTCDLPLEHN